MNNKEETVETLQEEISLLKEQTKALRQIFEEQDLVINRKNKEIRYLLKALKKIEEVVGSDFEVDI